MSGLVLQGGHFSLFNGRRAERSANGACVGPIVGNSVTDLQLQW